MNCTRKSSEQSQQPTAKLNEVKCLVEQKCARQKRVGSVKVKRVEEDYIREEVMMMNIRLMFL